jgi:Niemann-Pick C1 protein
LVLAIGVDNVFILCHELERQNTRAHFIASGNSALGTSSPLDPFDAEGTSQDNYNPDLLPSVNARIATALSKKGPSILYATTCETVSFALGAMVGMPAVKNFAIYAAGSVVLNTLLQVRVLFCFFLPLILTHPDPTHVAVNFCRSYVD